MRTASAVSFVIVSLGAVACGGSNATNPDPASAPSSTSVQGVTPSRNLHLRAAFDDDPSTYVGRFVPAEVVGAELDENRAAQTVCSKYFTMKEVGVNQELDELVYASNQASAAMGVAAPGAAATGQGATSSGSVLRVRYKITKKVQVQTDAEGLSACCAKTPGACTNLVVGEFLRGSGEIYAAVESARSGSADVAIPPVVANAAYSDTSKWKKLHSFNDTYFAFLPVTTGVVNLAAKKEADAKAEQLEKSCAFCNDIPKSDSGIYFCGVSAPSPQESSGRSSAMDDARTQMVRYLGEHIQTSSSALSSTTKGLIKDERFTSSVAKGVASRVEQQKVCVERENSPERLSVYKILTFVPNAALADAAAAALEEVAAAKGAAVSPKDKTAASEAVTQATKR
ncbi:MAG: hypothetical protein KF795_10535 [Labilithrix sp.]|nr:hypothetical protein [Labilithrix sp.]